jgi:hypothetical protein
MGSEESLIQDGDDDDGIDVRRHGDLDLTLGLPALVPSADLSSLLKEISSIPLTSVYHRNRHMLSILMPMPMPTPVLSTREHSLTNRQCKVLELPIDHSALMARKIVVPGEFQEGQ